MNPSTRRHLAIWLVVLHAGLTVSAASLHALPGLGHGSELNRPGRNDHSHGPGKSSREATDDCAVCQFLAQGQLTSVPSAGPSAWVVAPAPLFPPVLSVSIEPRHTAAPRAPPAGDPHTTRV